MRAAALLGAALFIVGCGDDPPAGEPASLAPPVVASSTERPAGWTAVQWGEHLFREQGCTGCHHINGVRGVGGALNAIWGRERPLADGTTVVADEAYVRRSIVDPTADVVEGFEPQMPPYGGVLNDAQVDALVEYVASLE
jgi:cytochrome c oxidase subunit II